MRAKAKLSTSEAPLKAVPLDLDPSAEAPAEHARESAPEPAPSDDSPSEIDQTPMRQIVERHGDLLFDLCHSVLWAQAPAQQTFRAILRKVRALAKDNPYAELERAWIVRVACEKLIEAARYRQRKITPEEQIRLDSTEKISTRLKNFDYYFHRLRAEDQILMLLRDKYGFDYPEIASAMGLPEGSLRMRRQQALRALEEWLWDPR